MKQQEQQERNIEIVKMLGKELRYQEDSITIWSDDKKSSYGLLYHPSWEMLMSAVDFIEKQKIAVYINSNNCVIQSIGNKENKFKPTTYQDVYGSDKKEAVFIAVSEFAKLYNENKL
jgi:hypothetical protein